MTMPAAEVYEVVIDQTARPNRFFRSVVVLVASLFAFGDGPRNAGGRILRVIDRRSGEAVFSHIEALGEDHPDMLHALQHDLDNLSATEFADRWGV